MIYSPGIFDLECIRLIYDLWNYNSRFFYLESDLSPPPFLFSHRNIFFYINILKAYCLFCFCDTISSLTKKKLQTKFTHLNEDLKTHYPRQMKILVFIICLLFFFFFYLMTLEGIWNWNFKIISGFDNSHPLSKLVKNYVVFSFTLLD